MTMYVKSLRQKNNWSQEQLAQLSGLNIRTIQRAEKGESVGVETLKALASVFNVDINELKSKHHNENKSDEIQMELEREKLEEAIKTELKSKREFYLLSFSLLGVFILFFLPNYNGGENLGALISCAVSFALIIGFHAYSVFQPFGDKWEKKQIKQAMDRYEKER